MKNLKDMHTTKINKLYKVLAMVLTITLVAGLFVTNSPAVFAQDNELDWSYSAEIGDISSEAESEAHNDDGAERNDEVEDSGTDVNDTVQDSEENAGNDSEQDGDNTSKDDEYNDYPYSDGEYGDTDENEIEEDDYEYELEEVVPPALGGTGIVAFSGGADIEITAFTSTNQVFTTNDSNLMPLSLQIAYRIVGEGDAAGGEIRIALEDDGVHPKGTFFATTVDRINVMLSDAGQQHIDEAGIFVESISGQNTLVIPFTGGENNVTLDTITVNIEYNRVWDGTIPPGSHLNAFEAWAVNNGMQEAALTIDVTSHTTDTRGFRSTSWMSVQTLQLDNGVFSFGVAAAMILEFPATSNRWKFAEDTQVTFTAPIPSGAHLGTIASTPADIAYNITGDEIVWEIDASDINAELRFFPRMQFPSTHFSDGQVLVLDFTVNYFLQDAITGNPFPVTRTITATITLEAFTAGVPDGEVILNWSHSNLSMVANNNNALVLADIGVDNQNNLPAENVVITIYNNDEVSGNQTGSKLRHHSAWQVSNISVRVTSHWTFFIRDIYGNERVVQHNQAAAPFGGSVFNMPGINSLTGVAANGNEYIDRIEIRPQHNGNNALAPGADFRVRIRYSGFSPAGIDHTGGSVGANVDGFVDIPIRATITHDGLAETFERSASVRYYAFTHPAHDAWVSSMATLHGNTAIEPGGVLPVRFLARSDDSQGTGRPFLTRGILWERPSFLLFVPQGASIDTSQSVEAFRNMNGVSLGMMSIEFIGTEVTGQSVYRLQTQPGVAVAQTTIGANSNDVIRFDVDITTPIGVPAGAATMRVWAIGYAGEGARHTLYQVNGATSTGLTSAHGFYDDTVNNWTGHNHYAPYQRIRTANLSFTVASAAGMLARAQLWNHGGNAWQLGGVATVPVGGEGRFQLEVVNSGNQFVGDVRLYNILPHTAVTNTASGVGSVTSEWNATLSSLDFRVYDRFGADITGTFTGSQIFVSQQTNANPSTNHPINRNLINSDFAAVNATNIETARSFVFDLGTHRLPPGARIVIEGNVALPATMTAAGIGETAQNSFVTSGQFFNAATGTAGQTPTPQIDNIQTFEATAENNTSIPHTVTYVAAGTETSGTAPDAVDTYFGEEVTIAGQGTLVQAGYSFVGWRNSVNNNVYMESDTLTISGDVTLTAVWLVLPRYMVSYNGNGSTGGSVPAGNEFIAGAVVTVAGQGDLVRGGHTFLGWSTMQGAAIAEFVEGGQFTMPAAHRVLYAVWQGNNGGGNGGSPDGGPGVGGGFPEADLPGRPSVPGTPYQPGQVTATPGTMPEVVLPATEQQGLATPPVMYGEAVQELPSIVAVEGYPAEGETVAEIGARANPQTGDNGSVVGLIVTVFGPVVPAAIVFLAIRRFVSKTN